MEMRVVLHSLTMSTTTLWLQIGLDSVSSYSGNAGQPNSPRVTIYFGH